MGTWEEYIEAAGYCILSNQDIEDVEGDLVKEIAHNLEN